VLTTTIMTPHRAHNTHLALNERTYYTFYNCMFITVEN